MSTHSRVGETNCETVGRSDLDSLKDTIALQQRHFERWLVSQELQSKKLAEAHEASINAVVKETATCTAELNAMMNRNLVQPTTNWSKKGKDQDRSLRETLRRRPHEESGHRADNYISPDRRKAGRSVDWRSSDAGLDRRRAHRTHAKGKSADGRGLGHHIGLSRSRDERSVHHHGDRSVHRRGDRSRSPDRHLHRRARSREREDRRKEQHRFTPGSPDSRFRHSFDKCKE